MSDPWDEFIARIPVDTDEVNLYPAMAENIQTPAIVMVPDDPWLTSEGGGYRYDVEHYHCIALAASGDPVSALATLHGLVHAIREAGDAGWEIGDVSGVRDARIPDDGTRYLGSWVRVTYRNCEHQVEEGS